MEQYQKNIFVYESLQMFPIPEPHVLPIDISTTHAEFEKKKYFNVKKKKK